MFINDDAASSAREFQRNATGDFGAVFREVERELRSINQNQLTDQIRSLNDSLVSNNVLPQVNILDFQARSAATDRRGDQTAQQRVIIDQTDCGTYTYGSASPEWQNARRKVKEELKDEVRSGEVKVRYGVTVWDVAEANLKAHNTERPTNAQILAETKRIEQLNKICRADLTGVTTLNLDAPPTERREPTEAPPRRTGDKVEQGTGTPKVDLPGGRKLELGTGHYVKTTFNDGNQKYEFDNGSGCTIQKRGDTTIVKQWGRRPEDNVTHIVKGNDEVVLRQDGSVAKKISYPTDRGLTTEHNEPNGQNYTTTEWPNGTKRTTWKDTSGNTVGHVESTDADSGKRKVRFGHPNQNENYTTVEYSNGARKQENQDGSGFYESAPDSNGNKSKRYWGPRPEQNRTVRVDSRGREH